MSNPYKKTALEALRGNWKTAIKTGFVATLLGGVTTGSFFGNSNASDVYDLFSSEEAGEFFISATWQEIRTIVLLLAVVIAVWAIVSLVIGGAVCIGYNKYNLNLIDRKSAGFSDLFSSMDRKWTGFCMNFLMGLYTLLWSLLLVFPGIVKTFAYAMTPFILAENPDMSANEAITASKELMDGHKWDLWYLSLTFIGWSILVSAPALIVIIYVTYCVAIGTMGFGGLIAGFAVAVVLTILCELPYLPYRAAATAAFYREISPAKTEDHAAWYQPM